MKKWILYRKNKAVISALFQEDRMTEYRVCREDTPLIGSIYNARVESLLPGLKAAFVSIGERNCYLPLSDDRLPLFTKQLREGKLTVGDEILVQGEKDALKTKDPVVSDRLKLAGRCCLLQYPGKGISFSRKFGDDEKKKELKKAFLHTFSEIGILFRTNALTASFPDIEAELVKLQKELEELLSSGQYRKGPGLLRAAAPEYLKAAVDSPGPSEASFVTDDPFLFEQLRSVLESHPQTAAVSCSLYEDKQFSLEKCCRIPFYLEKAQNSRVWLNSGAYLVIEPTEALTAIDVNTGKSTAGKKDPEAYYYKINEEAAKEIMYQLHIRNLSGMILVDFINMKDRTANQRLMELLRGLAKQDPVLTTVVDMTGLGLVEITRKKEKDTLERQLKLLEES